VAPTPGSKVPIPQRYNSFAYHLPIVCPNANKSNTHYRFGPTVY
jgi:hypothetical protein